MTRGEKARSAMREAMRSSIILERKQEARTEELKAQGIIPVSLSCNLHLTTVSWCVSA